MVTDAQREIAMAIASRIRELRAARGWSQEKLSRVADMSNMTIRRAESGEQMSDWSTLETIASALGVGLKDLLPLATKKSRPAKRASIRYYAHPAREQAVSVADAPSPRRNRQDRTQVLQPA